MRGVNHWHPPPHLAKFCDSMIKQGKYGAMIGWTRVFMYAKPEIPGYGIC
jgi:hypothetical protein